MASVELQHVTKKFGQVVAIDDLSIVIDDGEFIVLVGASGCGKTTILRMLAGLEQSTSGKLLIGDHVVNDIAARDRNVSMVFQNHALYPHMNVRQNIEFGLKTRRETSDDVRSRVDRAATTLGIDVLLERQPDELSGGEQQRVALAKAMASQPDVWLLDEPLSHLDTKLRHALKHELATQQRELGITTILVTHDLSEAMSLGDRIVMLDNGRVHQIGTPREVYDRPTNRLVATSFGQPPMNILPATVQMKDDRCIVSITDDYSLEATDAKSLLTGRTEVDLGIRGEDVVVRPHGTSSDVQANLPAKVERIEFTGRDCLVHLRVGSTAITACVPRDVASDLSGTVAVEFPVDRTYWFDHLTGKRLS